MGQRKYKIRNFDILARGREQPARDEHGSPICPRLSSMSNVGFPLHDAPWRMDSGLQEPTFDSGTSAGKRKNVEDISHTGSRADEPNFLADMRHPPKWILSRQKTAPPNIRPNIRQSTYAVETIASLQRRRRSLEYSLPDHDFDEIDSVSPFDAMFQAICHSDSTSVKEIVDQGFEINQQDNQHGSPLCVAALHGNADIVKTLLDLGAEVNLLVTRGGHGSALVAACGGGQVSSLETLLLHGAAVDMQLIHGQYGSALAAASGEGNIAMASHLLDAGASVNMPITSGHYGNALAAASHKTQADMIKFLIQRGADVDMELQNGQFPVALVAAVSSSNLENVRALLEAGADPNTHLPTGSYGDAVSLAIQLKNKPLVRLLINYGAVIGPLATDLIYKENLYGSLPTENHTNPRLASVLSANKPQITDFYCELPAMAKDQDDLQAWLYRMAVLVRQEDRVEFSTIYSLLSKEYGNLGIRFLEGMVRALISDEQRYVDGYMAIKVFPKSLVLENSLLNKEIPSMFKWICLTVRRQVSGSICLSSLYATYGSSNHFSLSKMRLYPAPEGSGGCWKELFNTAVITVGPKAQSQERCRGLELDCDIMIQFAAVEYPVRIHEDKSLDPPSKPGLVFLGYSNALIPIRETSEGMILWHLETSIDGSQIKVYDLKATRQPWLPTTDLDYLRSKKALLGWCSQAEICLGRSTDDLNVTWSDTDDKSFSLNPETINLQALVQSAAPIQAGLSGGMTFRLENHEVRHDSNSQYYMCLNNGKTEPIVLYDTSAQRAWLLPLISVYHHMLLVYWKRIEEGSRSEDIPLATAITSPGSPNASFTALENSGKKSIQGSNQDSDPLTVQKMILAFSVNLGRMERRKPSGRRIYGWEFMDLATDSRKTTLRQVSIKRDCLAWAPLLESITCLFCSELGDAIVGQRTQKADPESACNQLPKGCDLLAAPVHIMERLSETRGPSRGRVRRLSNNHAWEITGSPFKRCRCRDSNQVPCWDQPDVLQQITPLRSPLQRIVPLISARRSGRASSRCSDGAPKVSLQDHVNGAVSFGRRVRGDTVQVPTQRQQAAVPTPVYVQSSIQA